MIKTAIILAGGLGTRLRSAVADLPKCMAPVEGIPFLSFVISWLKNEGIEQFIFSLGYKSEAIIDYVEKEYPLLQKYYAVEKIPLGTGGAIKLAAALAKEENVIVVNGDTLFTVDLKNLSALHLTRHADCTIALKQMVQFDRYGAVEINSDQSIIAFKEKQFCAFGTINGGVYALLVSDLVHGNYPEAFSFEKEWLEKNTGIKKMYGSVNDGYFIDIGIPEDYQLFQQHYHNTMAAQTAPNTTNPTAIFLKALST